MSFQAIRVSESDGKVRGALVQMEQRELTAGELLIAVEYSSINYKDALAVTGRGKIMRKLPLNAGIDLAGTVLESSDPSFKPGDKVLANGCGLGEAHDGGLAERVRLPLDWAIKLPEGLSTYDAMRLGTGGFTAALAFHRMLENGQHIDKGPIVVTGATGGVGSVAVALFAKQGYEVIALSSRPEHSDYLRKLGASKVCTVEQLALGKRPLEAAKFGGVVDNIGGETLAQLLAHVDLWGNVASIGLADNEKLNATVFPFILRGVSLLGISSANCPMPLRREVWKKLGGQWRFDFDVLATETIGLADVPEVASDLLNRKRYGRTIVKCS
ncbi:YhdH/YhfP family quinone oxidoreductase [Permianibacter aggregans]|uniref:NADPH2:quinone reductase n=1 Tax=Permianibacter aggregans TaxID=1510150 RepID=A0A4R6UTI6_9GAMM|nr:YhdH/YhfP family quinone oxidoreductase [Permianibacter aggregans]QGX38832.1 acryloyl-CoA reductase [Permianibacter aggregans]TDQ50638.1 NADPH2:quinone reductase [Permianibacter aggregans]